MQNVSNLGSMHLLNENKKKKKSPFRIDFPITQSFLRHAKLDLPSSSLAQAPKMPAY
jgi:hypothetical protein